MGEGLNEIIFRTNPTILKYIPHRHRATYLNTHDLRSSTPTTYVAQRLAARACLEVPFTTFGGSIHYIWRLHSLRLEAPFTTFGGSIHHVRRLRVSVSSNDNNFSCSMTADFHQIYTILGNDDNAIVAIAYQATRQIEGLNLLFFGTSHDNAIATSID